MKKAIHCRKRMTKNLCRLQNSWSVTWRWIWTMSRIGKRCCRTRRCQAAARVSTPYNSGSRLSKIMQISWLEKFRLGRKKWPKEDSQSSTKRMLVSGSRIESGNRLRIQAVGKTMKDVKQSTMLCLKSVKSKKCSKTQLWKLSTRSKLRSRSFEESC